MIVGVALCTSCSRQDGNMRSTAQQNSGGATVGEVRPTYLYKVISVSDWKNSCKKIQLPCMDADFIHLSTEEQLDRIIAKYWSEAPEYVLLKLETAKLPGELVLEANPGGTNKYYHLYHGSIPFSAILEVKVKKAPR